MMMMREEGNIAQEIKEIINNTKSRRRKKNTERSISIRRQIHVYDSVHIAIR